MKIVSFLPSIGEQFFILWSIKTPKISVRSNFFNNAKTEINNVFGFFCMLASAAHSYHKSSKELQMTPLFVLL